MNAGYWLAQRFPPKCCALPLVRIFLFIVAWYFLGTVLSFYNKLLLGKDSRIFNEEAFPAPLFMAGLQFAMQHVLARLVFSCGLAKRTAEHLSWQEWFKSVVPNGTCTGMDIGFSMMSLVFISLSFYTMCKATVPLFLLGFAFLWGIEKPSWRLGLVVFIISCGLVLLVKGETNFDAAGFTLVMVAACLSGLRFTLTQVFLHGHHDCVALGGPLEILEALTPVMSGTVLVLSLVWERLWVTLPSSMYFETWEQSSMTMALIFIGAILAFLLVWTEYRLIKETSSLTFMIAGTCKEIVTVLAAVFFMGDAFGYVNFAGLAIVIFGVALFNLYKFQRVKKGEIVLKPGRTGVKGTHEADGEGGVSGDQEMQPLMARSESLPGEASPEMSSSGNGRRPQTPPSNGRRPQSP